MTPLWGDHNRDGRSAGRPAEVAGREQRAVLAQLAGRAAGRQFAVGQDVAAVGDLQGQVDVLLDQEHAGPWLVANSRPTGSSRSTITGARPRLISSSMSSFGLRLSTRARASICCSPPDSRPALRPAFVGQISVVQLALAGAAGFTISHMAVNFGITFPVAALAGIAVAVVIGLVTAASAVRVRGVSLAVVTLAGAVAIENFGFAQPPWG